MTSEMILVFQLMFFFQMKQFLADFVLQRGFMLKKSMSTWEFLWPLTAHCLVHGVGTVLILSVFAPTLWYLCFFDFVVHFMMDRIKSGPRYLGRFDDRSKNIYWVFFGFDQMVHHLTHLYMVWVVIQSLASGAS